MGSASRRKPQRARDLKVTDEDYAAMLAAQHGGCAIVGCNRTPKTRRFHVDHNHATGAVRGLLCHWHNRIMPRDSREAYALAVYLERHEDRPDPHLAEAYPTMAQVQREARKGVPEYVKP